MPGLPRRALPSIAWPCAQSANFYHIAVRVVRRSNYILPGQAIKFGSYEPDKVKSLDDQLPALNRSKFGNGSGFASGSCRRTWLKWQEKGCPSSRLS